MPSDWQSHQLKEIAEVFDGPHATPSKTRSGPIFLGISNLAGGRLDLSDTEHLSERDFGRWTRRVTPQLGDVVFSYETRLGEAALIPDGLRCCLGRRMGLLRARPGKVDSRFLLYAYLGPEFQHTLQSRTVPGSTVDRIPLVAMPEFPMRIPTSLVEQRAIANILGSLDDKIELSRRTNETLEAMARAIFKSWFVDFVPIHAKAESRQPFGMDAETAALFPDSFEDSPLGKIPKGWKAGRIGDRARAIQYGLTRSASTEAVGPRFLRITDIRGGHVNWSLVPYCSVSPEEHEKYRILPGDILVARTGASTGENIYVVEPPDSVFASYLIRLQFSDSAMARVAGQFMRTGAYFDYVAGAIGGSAQPNASAQVLSSAPFVFPPPSVAERFARTVAPFDKLCAENSRQAQALVAIRDALLPKLISGEIRVAELTSMLEPTS